MQCQIIRWCRFSYFIELFMVSFPILIGIVIACICLVNIIRFQSLWRQKSYLLNWRLHIHWERVYRRFRLSERFISHRSLLEARNAEWFAKYKFKPKCIFIDQYRDCVNTLIRSEHLETITWAEVIFLYSTLSKIIKIYQMSIKKKP